MEKTLKDAVYAVCTGARSAKKQLLVKKLEPLSHELDRIASAFDITHNGALVLSILFEMQFRKSHGMDPDDIMNELQISTWDWINMLDDVEVLVKRGLVQRNKSFRSAHMGISQQARKAILTNTPYREKDFTGLNDRKFYRALEKMVRRFFDEDQFTAPDFLRKVNELFASNPELTLPRYLQELQIDPLQTLFLQVLAGKTMDDESLDLRQFARQFDTDDLIEDGVSHSGLGDLDEFVRSFWKEENSLFKKGVVELRNEGPFTGPHTYVFTSEVAARLFADVHRLENQGKSGFFSVVNPSDIQPVELHYDESTSRELDEINLLLHNYGEVFKRQQEMNTKPQLKILLQGPPGSGKTSYINMLCKKHNRPCYNLNLESVRDSYFSESERKTKHMFNEIRKCVRQHVQAGQFDSLPIFALNEADGFLFADRKRLYGSSSTDNTVANITSIVLNEMENLEPGTLLFVTSNIASTYDEAMARRFSHRINISVPKDPGTRLAIFKSVFGNRIPETWMKRFAKEHTVTGAHIANVYNRFINHYIVRAEFPGKETLDQWLQAEAAGWKSNSPIGFH